MPILCLDIVSYVVDLELFLFLTPSNFSYDILLYIYQPEYIMQTIKEIINDAVPIYKVDTE